jgi:hypothetical protein
MHFVVLLLLFLECRGGGVCFYLLACSCFIEEMRVPLSSCTKMNHFSTVVQLMAQENGTPFI